jgi:hypothetical protein
MVGVWQIDGTSTFLLPIVGAFRVLEDGLSVAARTRMAAVVAHGVSGPVVLRALARRLLMLTGSTWTTTTERYALNWIEKELLMLLLELLAKERKDVKIFVAKFMRIITSQRNARCLMVLNHMQHYVVLRVESRVSSKSQLGEQRV